jgi:hypothetical protein
VKKEPTASTIQIILETSEAPIPALRHPVQEPAGYLQAERLDLPHPAPDPIYAFTTAYWRMIYAMEGTMKSMIVVAFSLLVASVALAGEIYGTISDAGKPVPAGVKVVVNAGENTYTGETDKFGAYHVFAQDKGKCTLTVHYKDQKLAVAIFSYEKATRYDWTVETVDNKLTLKRK